MNTPKDTRNLWVVLVVMLVALTVMPWWMSKPWKRPVVIEGGGERYEADDMSFSVMDGRAAMRFWETHEGQRAGVLVVVHLAGCERGSGIAAVGSMELPATPSTYRNLAWTRGGELVTDRLVSHVCAQVPHPSH